ncbi:WAT1-related protein At1g09380-like [Lycium barbarum]|uniref:WAT1-related protein At1g09380-like n=1 Tax=Lycium barbarum TaxID=112863 RepID=UPI00293EFF22|nr:WAT1-related protein At1g09380-like [Lycium barbarum]
MGMVIVQVIAGTNLLTKVILNQGTFVFSFLAYRHIVAALCMAPFAFLWERESLRKLTWPVFFWLSLGAVAEIILAMGLSFYGLRDTTATYAINFLNLIPIVTFVLSTIFRMEKLRLNTKTGQAKVLGTILCLAGALIISLYKGKIFYISHHSKKLHVTKVIETNMVRGTIFLICSCLSYSGWYIIQVKLSKVFPHKYSSTFFICIIATIQSVVVGLCIDRRKKSWKLEFDFQLLTIFYSGALATASTFCLISWTVSKRGPTYPSMFNPLYMIFVAIVEAAFLGQETSVGSLLGMFVILVGLYLFLRAKNQELKQIEPDHASGADLPTVPGNAELMQSTNIVIPSLASESARSQSSRAAG